MHAKATPDLVTALQNGYRRDAYRGCRTRVRTDDRRLATAAPGLRPTRVRPEKTR